MIQLNRYIIAKGEGVMKRKKKRRLLTQILIRILPIFMIMIAAVVWTIYTSSINSYLKSDRKRLTDMLGNVMSVLWVDTDNKLGDKVHQWNIDQLEALPENEKISVDDESYSRMVEYYKAKDSFQASWFLNMPPDVRHAWFTDILDTVRLYLNKSDIKNYSGTLFMIDAQDTSRMRVLLDYRDGKDAENTGSFHELDISQHPVLKEAFESGSGEIIAEKATDFLAEGNYYICYKPIVINGKVNAVLGITYKWDDLRKSVINTIFYAIIIIAAGMVLVMLALIIVLNRKAVRPVGKIQDALLEYTDDKDANLIVKKMYSIKEKNELGYLADVISDLALEIDHYYKESMRVQKELYDAQVQIMVSQIQPHFMYNALSSIAILCRIKPETAYEATINFSRYLRGNMDSLKQTEPVAFEVELDHLKKYLYIEKLRFADKLNIEYDIQTTDFVLPMLSIQPIVENAVKHGVGMKDDGGTVTIATRETEDAYEVIISDDGVGFDMNAPKKDDGRSHIGMENTKKRLKDMCNAEIIITSEVGKGTTARVIIPKDKKEEKQ